jgi:hypothetical protein
MTYKEKQLEYTKAYQKRHTDAGLCPCGRVKISKTKCQKCLDDRRKWYEKNKVRVIAHMNELSWERKEKAIAHYGGICTCCGEDYLPFLVLDHINGGGIKLRLSANKYRGNSYYYYLEREGWPDGIQVLCANCNTAKGHNNKPCIHQMMLNN